MIIILFIECETFYGDYFFLRLLLLDRNMFLNLLL